MCAAANLNLFVLRAATPSDPLNARLAPAHRYEMASGFSPFHVLSQNSWDCYIEVSKYEKFYPNDAKSGKRRK